MKVTKNTQSVTGGAYADATIQLDGNAEVTAIRRGMKYLVAHTEAHWQKDCERVFAQLLEAL
jgi:hypothetical protein